MEKDFDKDLIQLNVNARDREEAVKIAFNPLLRKGKIKEEYIQNVINSMNNIGPYFVLLPKVALPHARPEEGAIENAIGITVLNKPVNFGSESNDPIKYLFPLSAVNSGDHLDVLSTLSLLVEDESFFNVLDNANKPEDVLEYINNINRKED